MIIRPAIPEDALVVATVRVESWRATYRGIVSDSYLDRMSAEEDVGQWRKVAAGEMADAKLLVCEEGGRVVGFSAYGAAREPHFDLGGELYATYLLPDFLGNGFGSAMAADVVRGLRTLGYDAMILWVIEENARARRFYEHHLGGSVVPDSRKSFDIDGHTIWEIAYGFRPLPELPLRR